MVITFDNSDSVIQAYDLLRVSFYEDKKLLGMRQSYFHYSFVPVLHDILKVNISYFIKIH